MLKESLEFVGLLVREARLVLEVCLELKAVLGLLVLEVHLLPTVTDIEQVLMVVDPDNSRFKPIRHIS